MRTGYSTKRIREFFPRLWDKVTSFYWNHWPYDWRPGQIWYRLKCFLWFRYSTVRPRYLPHTWCDRDTLLAHSMFEILSKFIEEECSPGWVEWYGENGHKIAVNGVEVYARDEMQNLYDWWHKDYIIGYPATCDALWEAAEKNQPTKLLADHEDYCTWDPQFDSDDAEQQWHQKMDELNKLEYAMDAELLARLHRLVNLMPYLWT